MTTLILVRHGQSVANLGGIFAGHTDIPLTELGLLQARRTAAYLDAYPIDYIYSSDLLRAMQTAEATATRRGMEIRPHEGLREVYAGDWEGALFADLPVHYPESFRIWREHFGLAQPDHGESIRDLAERLQTTVVELVKKHPGKTLALFTHAAAIRSLATGWHGYPIEEAERIAFPPNASVTLVDFDDNLTPHLRLYGYDDHQAEAATSLPAGSV